MFVINGMHVGITYTSPLNAPDYNFRVKLFVGPSVTSSRSLKVQLGFLLGFEGIANHSSAISASLCEITVTKIRFESETHHPCAEKHGKGNEDEGMCKCQYFTSVSRTAFSCFKAGELRQNLRHHIVAKHY